jgi:hypothetical protein
MRTTKMHRLDDNFWYVELLENGICVATKGFDHAKEASEYAYLYEDGEFNV